MNRVGQASPGQQSAWLNQDHVLKTLYLADVNQRRKQGLPGHSVPALRRAQHAR